MVLHRSVLCIAFHTVRVLGLTVAYTLVLVTGTAVFIAALGSLDDSREASAMTQQSTTIDSAIQAGNPAPEAFLLASRTISNDKRGY